MPRPEKTRTVCFDPETTYFKPRGMPLKKLEIVNLSIDELEAMRLCYMEGLYHEAAAKNMNVSRQTIGRILNNALNKVTDALVNGMAIKIEGGNIKIEKIFRCADCGHEWAMPRGSPHPEECRSCHSRNFHRSRGSRGFAGRKHGRAGRGRT